MGYSVVLYVKEDGIATITFNRPEVLNAFNLQLVEEAVDALRDASEDPNVRVVVIRGAGRAFSAGDDLKELQPPEELSLRTGPEYDEYLRRGSHRLVREIRYIKKPVIASIHGICYGAGFIVALACDFRIASEDARFSTPFILRGLAWGAYILQLAVGFIKATELLLTGRVIDAKEAEQMGLINRVVQGEMLEAVTREFAERFVDAPTATIGMIKTALNMSLGATLERGLENDFYTCLCTLFSEDTREGIRSFLERRKPLFKGR